MGRWQPDARGRLARAAFELYAEQGFEKTTGTEIAERAGMHERSFFRLFADKREVPFHGMEAVAADLAETVRQAPVGLGAAALAERAVATQCARIQEHSAMARLRHQVISSSAELRERDLAKHSELASALAGALGERDVPERPARLVAEACMIGLRHAVDEWMTDTARLDLVEIFRATMTELAGALGAQ